MTRVGGRATGKTREGQSETVGCLQKHRSQAMYNLNTRFCRRVIYGQPHIHRDKKPFI